MKTSQAGFTIIEMAMVMVLIGLIVGYGASLIKPLSIRAKRIESTEIVNASAEAVVGYAANNSGVLPSVALFPGILKKRNDAWRRPLNYVVDVRLTDGDLATGDLCTRRSSFISLRQCNDAACSAPVTIDNVAYVLLSGGENFNNQTAATLAVSAATIIDVYTTRIDGVDGDNTDFNRPEVYDDIVQWATMDELRGRVGCRMPSLVVLNNELPPGDAGSPYSATIHPDGGVPFVAGGRYRWCIETPTGTLPDGLTFRDQTDSVDIGVDTDPAALDENQAAWIQADHIVVGGTPTTSGSYLLSIWARDNSNPGNDTACQDAGNLDNCIRRSFVLTVNP